MKMTTHINLSKWLGGWLLMLVLVPAQAVLTIEINRGVDAGIAVAIVPFQGNAAAPQDLAAIVNADLTRSGRFETLPKENFLSMPGANSVISYKDWRLLKAEAVAVGDIKALGGDRYQIDFKLYDVLRQTQLGGYRYTVSSAKLRRVAHKISDYIYEKLTGRKGAFDTRIAYVTAHRLGKGKSTYQLWVADSDAYNAKNILTSKEPIMSPAWSPDGRKLAYVSFEKKRSMIYVQNLSSGNRELVAKFRGLNSAPAWSPDGSQLAFSSSKDGNPEIYVMSVSAKQPRRLTRHRSIDTEPAWSPDGRSLVFTSDRAGRPQIYKMPASGGGARRLTFEGKYNARASYAPDGTKIVMVTQNDSGFHIATLDQRTGRFKVLTGTRLDESPSFAPNGDMILYATEKGGRGVMAAVSADGKVQQTLRVQSGDVREPAWSPFNRGL